MRVCDGDLHGCGGYLKNVPKTFINTHAFIHLTKSVYMGVVSFGSFGGTEVGPWAFVGGHGNRVNTQADGWSVIIHSELK